MPPDRSVSTYTARNLAKDGDIAAAQRVFVLEEPSTRLRRAPAYAGTLTRQSPVWGHNVAPFDHSEYDCAGLSLWRARDAIVSGRDGVALLNDDTFDSEQAYFAQFKTGSAITRPVDGALSLTKPADIHIAGRAFLAFNGGHRNYAHWLTDHLITLWLYRERFARERVPLLLPDSLPGFARQTIEALELTDTLRWIGDEPVRCDELYFASRIVLPEPPGAFALAAGWLRERLGVAQAMGRGERLFISRRDSAARPCLNIDAVEALMMRHGFEIVSIGDMSLKAQAERFANAAFVAGFHGAGLINVMFCGRGAKVLELCPEHALQPHFWTISDAMGLDYGYVCGTSYERDDADTELDGRWDSPCSFDLPRVEAAIRAMDAL